MLVLKNSARALTLIELLVVIAVLVALAGIVIPLLDGSVENGATTSTRASMTTIRDAIMGSDKQMGYLQDVSALPEKLKDLFQRREVNSSALFPAIPPFDVNTHRGWNGPYLQGATSSYTIDAARNFTAAYGDSGDPAPLDGWGRPLIIQRPTTSDTDANKTLFTRVISAGPDGIIQTPPGVLYPTTAQRGDDIILFLKRSDVP